MREYPARQLGTGSFETRDRVRDDEHGGGIVTGTYGSKLSVDFDNVGTKRVAVECLRFAPWMPPELCRPYWPSGMHDGQRPGLLIV